MAIACDHEPDVRSAWRNFHRRRRIARHGLLKSEGGTVLMAVLVASLAFWAAAAYGLSLVL